ncbi:hypothetical protein SAMN06265348_10245 [Pedobacter westerhofensis]|uniref:DUF5689 domain-containing protein n=2 Tax=Pedobacter westerhofensis TaxID=425512 RepID=A0A521B6D5_9SPHI|nr:hypothetical protein SAMN06265348_10245 [Pedobacter westerhofensis]
MQISYQMKKIYLFLVLIAMAAFSGCKKNDNAEGTLSPVIAIVDLKDLYKGSDLSLSTANLAGAKEIAGVVISDAQSANTPAGIVVIQNYRRNALRGIALELGAAAATYKPGDSVIVQVAGATLGRVNGSMHLKGLPAGAVNKVAALNTLNLQSVQSGTLLASPDVYENTLVTISKAVTEPEPQPGDTFKGDKTINDGFGKLTLHTEASATFAAAAIPASANFTGIPVIVASGDKTSIQLWPRTADDVFELPLIKPSPVIITGYLTDPNGTDGNYEYIQLLATQDIDFAVTSYSLVACNNAGTNPAPANGWAVGAARSYKLNLVSGKVTKGQFFYVGGSKNIWGAGSTDISAAPWINSTQYANVPGADFGAASTNLLANSGNVAGIAVFRGITVNASTVPLDVIMYGGNGTVYAAGPPEIGYRITNTDYYSTINPVTRLTQGFYGGGTNTSKLTFPATGNFTQLGGIYDASTGQWIAGRTVTSIPLTKTSALNTIETGTGFTTLKN